jgi:glycopeptide antibiotics resistance protein
MTGMADVDDVILNACGALFGRFIAAILPERPHANQTAEEITESDDNA